MSLRVRLDPLEQHVLQLLVAKKSLTVHELLECVAQSVDLFKDHIPVPPALQEGTPARERNEAVNELLRRLSMALRSLGMDCKAFRDFDRQLHYAVVNLRPEDGVAKFASSLTPTQIQIMKRMLEAMSKEWKDSGQEEPPALSIRDLNNTVPPNWQPEVDNVLSWMCENQFLAGEDYLRLSARGIMDLQSWLGGGDEFEDDCVERAKERICNASVPEDEGDE